MTHYFENNDKLKSEIKTTKIDVGGQTYTFVTDHGVFAKKGLDLGTHILLDTISKEKLHGDVLDLGCGYGPIGIVLKNEYPHVQVDMVDINVRSLKLAKKNIDENQVEANVFESDGYSNVTGAYDYIVTNPPIRVGKEKLYSLLFGAKEHLKQDGELWIVIHKDQGAKSTAKALEKEYEVKVENKSRGFWIIRAKNR